MTGYVIQMVDRARSPESEVSKFTLVRETLGSSSLASLDPQAWPNGCVY